MSYYKTIAGVQYAKDLLDLAESLVSGQGDGRICVADIKQLVASAEDGPGVTETERRTLAYIAQNHNLTRAARRWFYKEFAPSHRRKFLETKGLKSASFREVLKSVVTQGEITSRDELIIALRQAMALELTTIPLYLTSLYSLKPEHKSTEAYKFVFSIAVEEMLHLGLVCNMC